MILYFVDILFCNLSPQLFSYGMPFLFYQFLKKNFFGGGGEGGNLLCHGVLRVHEHFVKGKQLVKTGIFRIITSH